MVAGPPPGAVRDRSELIRALVDNQAGALDALLAWAADQGPTAGCAALLGGLKDESERHLVIDPAISERLANALVRAADLARLPRFGALGLMARGDALRAQGHFPEAIALYDEAAEVCLALGDKVGWARSRTGFVFAAQFCGRGREALEIGERAYEVLARAGEHLRAGGLSNNLGTVHYQLGQYAPALRIFDRAISHFEQARAARPERRSMAEERIGKALSNKALVLTLQGRFDEAAELCERARAIFVEVGEVAQALRADHYRASIYAGRGQYTRALRIQVDALAEFERAGLHESVIQVSLDVVAAHLGLNRHAEALALAEELVTRCEQLGTPTEAAKARARGAQALAALGQPRPALDLLDAAADVFRRCGLLAEQGAATLQRARLHLLEGDWPAALQRAEEACALFAERGLSERRTHAELIRARAALELGQTAAAEQLAGVALQTSHELEALPLSHAAHHILARVAERRAQPARALDEYEAAINDLEGVQSSLTTELRTEFLSDKLEVYTQAIDCSLHQQQVERAFGYLERAKSRALVDYLSSSPEVQVRAGSAAEQALVDELARLRAEHAWFYGRLHGFGPSSQDAELSDAERGTLREAIQQRERRIVRIHERLALLRDAAGFEALGPRRDTRVRTLPRLEPGTLLVEYIFWEERGVAFVLSSDGLRAAPLATGLRTLRQLLGRWQVNLDSAARFVHDPVALNRLAPNARGQLGALYRALIEPLGIDLAGAERLIVVPFGPAHGIPFHALHDGSAHLVERLEVWTAPSSSLLQLCAERTPASANGSGALVVGYSGGVLPGVVEEARRVAALVGGDCFIEADATRAAVLAGAEGRPIVHLAAHGEARLDNPLFAHLTLADGQLSMADVFRLRLDGALVTLSACETGRSAVVGGDELVGLSRGFLFAGASTLVQSLWRVDDSSTARLMEQFYVGLGAGRPAGAALRSAQRALLGEGAHPYLWAPFQLVGYGGPPHRSRTVHTRAAGSADG